MKKITIYVVATIVLSMALTLFAAELGVVAKNSLDSKRPGEVVAIDWQNLVSMNEKLTPENARVLDSGGNVLRSQAVDNDGDEVADQLLFVADFETGESKNFEVRADGSLEMPKSELEANARFVPERDDDFAWENDVIAFRAYGPKLRDKIENCGIDCFMKRVKYPIIDRWYKRAYSITNSYHIDNGEGHDGYKVGDGLGCGGTAVWHNGELNKSNVYTSWKRFANGPIRAVFELNYGPWEVGGNSITETKHITIDLHQRLFKVEDSFFADGKPARLEVAVGLSTHKGAAKAFENRKAGWLYTWEKMDDYYFGTGIVVDPADIKDYKVLDPKRKYDDHVIYIVDTGDDGRFTYYAGYGWEKAREIVTREQWQAYIEDFIDRTANPIDVTVQ